MAKKSPDVASALAWLEAKSTDHDRKNMVKFAIDAPKFFGVSMANMKVLAKQLGRSHDLAEALWATGWYEARMVAAMVDEPDRVTAAQMDRWCKDFDNWGIVDTVCFVLFDRTPHAFARIEKWSRISGEFQKRAAFALLWAVSLHDKQSDDAPFRKCLLLAEAAAGDDRNFVKKAVKMALGAVARRSSALRADVVALSERLVHSKSASGQWIGRAVLRDVK